MIPNAWYFVFHRWGPVYGVVVKLCGSVAYTNAALVYNIDIS
ncbi:hypothetical protein [Vibrio sp. TRT 2004]